jgi:hypothetical protein
VHRTLTDPSRRYREIAAAYLDDRKSLQVLGLENEAVQSQQNRRLARQHFQFVYIASSGLLSAEWVIANDTELPGLLLRE